MASSDTDCIWIENDTYSEDVEAAKRADRLAELLAEREREYSEAGDAGQTARRMLQDANDDIRQAFEHIRAAVSSFPCAPDSSALHLETAISLLHVGTRARVKAFEYSNENRPPGRFPWTARLVEAYREGWDCGSI